MSPEYCDLFNSYIEKQKKDKQPSTIDKLYKNDRAFRYKFLAIYAPLHIPEMIQLLNSCIYEQKDGKRTISERGEYKVEKLINIFMKRAHYVLNQERYVEAASIAFAVIFSIEQDMCHVYDKGINYQEIIEKTFYFLATLANHNYNLETSVALIYIANKLLEEINEDERLYDEEWRDAIIALGKFNSLE